MGLNTNSTNRLPSRQTDTSNEIFSPAGMPDPVPGGTYVFKNDMTFTAPLNIADDALVVLKNEDGGFITTATYSGTGAFIRGNNIGEFVVEAGRFVFTDNNSSFFDVTGESLRITSADIIFEGTDNSIGVMDLTNIFVLRRDFIEGWKTGIVVKNTNFALLRDVILQSNFTGSGPTILFEEHGTVIAMDFITTVVAPAESFFDFRPTMSGTSTITSVLALFSGSFFTPGVTGTITNIVDNSIALTAVDSVSDNGGLAEFAISGTIPEVGQRVILSGFTTETSYNQTIIVTTQGASFFIGTVESTGIPLAFVQNDTTGDYQSNSATVTSVAHGQSAEQTLLITGTVNFNAGYSIFDPQTNDFKINLTAAFPGVETTGTWDTGSLTEKDNRLQVQDARFQKDSMIAGGWQLSGNVSATTVASGVFNDIDFTGSENLSYNERVTLINPSNGACRYDGNEPSVESVPLEFYLIPNNNSDREYDFKLLLDSGSGFVDLPDLIETRVNIKGTNDLVTTRRTVLLNPGDEYKWVQSGVGTTNGFTAERGCSTI